jgi:hypothetical protein
MLLVLLSEIDVTQFREALGIRYDYAAVWNYRS